MLSFYSTILSIYRGFLFACSFVGLLNYRKNQNMLTKLGAKTKTKNVLAPVVFCFGASFLRQSNFYFLKFPALVQMSVIWPELAPIAPATRDLIVGARFFTFLPRVGDEFIAFRRGHMSRVVGFRSACTELRYQSCATNRVARTI